MARKRRKPESEPPKRPRRLKPRSLEEFIQDFLDLVQKDCGQVTPLDKANAILLYAYQLPDAQQQVQLAKEALTICPDCADAYILLGEHAPSRKEALAQCEQGVAAGERALGTEFFQRQVGHFSENLLTRPYLRARLRLAHFLWIACRRDEAIQHLQDMLRLDPNDDQNVRHILAGFLLFLDRDEDLAGLLQQYPDEVSATWAYTKALLAFRKDGDTPEARDLLKKAKKTNKHVLPFLLDQKELPAQRPSFYRPGSQKEALTYCGRFLVSWKSTPGSLAWVRANFKKDNKDEPQPKGPLGVVKKWLHKNLPQEDDVWQADFRQFPNWIRIAGEPVRPWMVLVTSPINDLILANQTSDEMPTAALLWDTLVQAMQYPAAGEPHRPTEIQVKAEERWEGLQPHLEEIGVEVVLSEDLDQLDGVFRHMTEHVCGKPQTGLLDVPGMTPEKVGSFYQAAAAFFGQAPWKKIGYESAIKVECAKYHSGPWYAILMGLSGITAGLAVYDDLEMPQRMWARDDHESGREAVGTSVTFGEEWDIPVADLEAVERFGWQVARSDAYPEVFHKDRGMSVRKPLAWELELMEGCLRAVPEFVNRRKQDDPVREEFTVPVTSGQLKLGLSWVVGNQKGSG